MATIARLDVKFEKNKRKATVAFVVKGDPKGEAIGCLAENVKAHYVQDYYVRYRQRKLRGQPARLLNILVRLAEPAVGEGTVSLNVFTLGNVTYEPLPE